MERGNRGRFFDHAEETGEDHAEAQCAQRIQETITQGTQGHREFMS